MAATTAGKPSPAKARQDRERATQAARRTPTVTPATKAAARKPKPPAPREWTPEEQAVHAEAKAAQAAGVVGPTTGAEATAPTSGTATTPVAPASGQADPDASTHPAAEPMGLGDMATAMANGEQLPPPPPAPAAAARHTVNPFGDKTGAALLVEYLKDQVSDAPDAPAKSKPYINSEGRVFLHSSWWHDWLVDHGHAMTKAQAQKPLRDAGLSPRAVPVPELGHALGLYQGAAPAGTEDCPRRAGRARTATLATAPNPEVQATADKLLAPLIAEIESEGITPEERVYITKRGIAALRLHL